VRRRHLPAPLVAVAPALLVAVIAAALPVVLAATPAAAAPPPATTATTLADARAQVATLELRMGQATEAYDTARVQLNRSLARAATLRTAAAVQQQRVDRLRQRVDAFIGAVYRSGTLTGLNSLLSSGSVQTFLEQLATLDRLSRDQRQQLADFRSAQLQLTAQQAALGREVAAQQRAADTLQAQRTAIEADLARRRQVLAEVGAAAAAAITAPTPVSPPGTATGGGPAAIPAYSGPASGRGAIALRTAYAQLGKPYAWGGSGPGSFDCSGLTMYAWAAAGVALPHSAGMQMAYGIPVPRSALQPGDLVFFGAPVSHVGIFVSGDTIIGAPTFGDVVRFQSISGMGMPYAGAVRP